MEIINTDKLPKDNILKKFLKGKDKINLIAGAYGNLNDCAGIGEKIIKPETGGTFTKLLGCSYLYKGYPDGDTIEKLDVCKDTFWLFFKFFNTWIGRIIIGALIILPKRIMKKFVIKWGGAYCMVAYQILKRKVLKPQEFGTAMRELRRVLNALSQAISEEETELIIMGRKFIDIASMLLESDSAYKNRFQDVLPEFNIEAVKEDPIKELKRMVNLICDREVHRGMRNKWRKIESKLVLFLRVSKKARKLFIKFFEIIDMKRIERDEADWYFCLKRNSYNYGGISFEDRMEQRKKIDKKKGHQIPRLIIKQEAGGPF